MNKEVIKEGDYVSIDGTTGEVIQGKLKTVPSEVLQVIEGQLKAEESSIYRDYADMMSWADEVRKLGVRANADLPGQAKTAVAFGAEGIGLCRTEHMFFEGERIDSVREMILAEDKEGREKALSKLLPFQREDFKGLFRVMDGMPVIIRTLDPPLHEFLPHGEKAVGELAKKMNVSREKLEVKIESLREANPMLGHRGCRLSITYPELCVMQTTAIIEAAVNMTKKGIKVLPEIMVPLAGTVEEFDFLEEIIRKTADDIIKKSKKKINYTVGTMIEIPRAALTADKIAEKAEFFSFGTNDLTQMTFGYSRDDAGVFLPEYVEKKILKIGRAHV